MSYIVVSPLSRIAETAVRHDARSMVSLLGEGHSYHRPGVIPPDRHLKIDVNDIAAPAPGLLAPQESHVERLIAFARAWTRDRPVLVHCWMGISRSPAAALVMALALHPDQDDGHLARRLRAAAPSATPNRRIVEIGDAALARGGALVSAVKRIGRGADAMEGLPFRFDIAQATGHGSGTGA